MMPVWLQWLLLVDLVIVFAEHLHNAWRKRKIRDWRAPQSAIAWGAIYRKDNNVGWKVHVEPANGHVLTEPTEWWMLMDDLRAWYKTPLGFTEAYGLKAVAAQYLQEAQQDWRDPASALAWGVTWRQQEVHDSWFWQVLAETVDGRVDEDLTFELRLQAEGEACDRINKSLVCQRIYPRYVLMPLQEMDRPDGTIFYKQEDEPPLLTPEQDETRALEERDETP